MKLHVFDSCPFCVRVKTVIGLKNLNCEIKPMTLGQLPASLEGKLERLIVPVLELHQPHDRESSLMVESLDIIRYLDQLDKPLFEDYEISEPLQGLLTRLNPVSAQLLYPRMPKLNLPELASPLALKMFTESRKNALGQSIDQALARTQEYLPELQQLLEELESFIEIDNFISGKRALSIDDVVIFAEIRNYTMIAELQMSERLMKFVHTIASRSGVSLYPKISK
jgi:glutaredoxin 2